ncbi:hypothetical protein [Pseudescherichia sp.]|uniref:hypothetical protein n=1 Tax=Pseudescherichia sp. TaxID=2055881 RepID=UPI00289D7DF8|nr:hypothetical protein [Pseudescherichia sp.]
MSNITLYTLPDFQGEQISLSPHEVMRVYTTEGWTYQSAQLNGNKLMFGTWYEIFSPIDYEEYFSSEDISNFADALHMRSYAESVDVINLNANDVIVNLDVHQDLRGFRSFVTCEPSLPGVLSRCYENYTTDRTLCTIAILNSEKTTAEVTVWTKTNSQHFVAEDQLTYGIVASVIIHYSSEDNNISVVFTEKDQLSIAIEKMDENHFIIHTTLAPLLSHCLLHSIEDYRGDNAVLTSAQLFKMKGVEGHLKYKSMEIVTTFNCKTAWLWTDYPKGGDGYDFNQYRSYAAISSLSSLFAVFDNDSSSDASCIYREEVIPVFVRLNNVDSASDWKDFVFESSFTTALFTVKPAVEYTSFCSENPAALQESLLCVIGEFETDYNECVLRYGTLSADGSTAIWNGETTLLINSASRDKLLLSLGPDAPADWSITSITKGEGVWYVDLTGSGVAA